MPISRALAILTALVGAGVAIWTGARAFGPTPPPLPLTIVLIGAGVVSVALAFGLGRRSRAAWAFMLPLTAIGVIVVLIALPAIVRSGTSPAIAGLAVAFLGGLLTLLIIGRGDLS